MPLSPDVQSQIPLQEKRPRPSLSSVDPNEVHDLTEEPDVVVRSAKLPRSSLFFEHPYVEGGQFENPFPHPAQPVEPSEGPYVGGGQHQNPDPNSDPVQPVKPSEDPDVGGGQHQNTDPIQPAKPSEPVRRTLKELLDESPKLSIKRDVTYASFFHNWKEPENIALHKSVEASIPEFGTPIVWKIYGPDTLPEAAAAGASKRTHPDTPLCNTVDSLTRKGKEDSKSLGKEVWNEFVERQKSTWQCEICMKTGYHINLDCPYLDSVPKGASVGPGYEIFCKGCGWRGKHDDTDCVKRAIRVTCFICGSDHWGDVCPRAKQHITVPYPFSLSNR